MPWQKINWSRLLSTCCTLPTHQVYFHSLRLSSFIRISYLHQELPLMPEPIISKDVLIPLRIEDVSVTITPVTHLKHPGFCFYGSLFLLRNFQFISEYNTKNPLWIIYFVRWLINCLNWNGNWSAQILAEIVTECIQLYNASCKYFVVVVVVELTGSWEKFSH